jgi:MFS family permease
LTLNSTLDAASSACKSHAWQAVGAAFVVAVFGWGIGFYGPPVYLEIVRQSRGWPIVLISGAVTLHFLVGLAIIPRLAGLYRRFGLSAVTFTGGCVMAAGVLGWSLARSPWELYVAALLTGGGWSALGAFAVNAIVAPWFSVKRPLALGIAFNGGSVGGVIFSPAWVGLIGSVGFPTAALIVGAAMLVILGMLSFVILRRAPESAEMDHSRAQNASYRARGGAADVPPSGHSAPLYRDLSFLTLCAGMTLALFAQTGLVAHLVSVLSPALGTQGAGWAAGLAGVSAVVGRLVVGWRSSSQSNWRAIASLSVIAQAVGCGVFLFQTNSSSMLIVGVVLFGLGVGNAISVPPVIANLEFSKDAAIRVVAYIVAISQGAYAIAPAIFGFLRQSVGDKAIFGASIAVECLAAFAYMSGGKAFARKMHSVNESM